MKKNLVVLGAILIAGASVFTSCKKDDVTAPDLALNGNAEMIIDLGDSFVDPGATATDDMDKDIQSKVVVTGAVDANKIDTYTLTYNVSDAAGNPATEVKRVVKVRAKKLSGTYNWTDSGTTTTGSLSVTDTDSQYNKLFINDKFAAYQNSTVYIEISGTSVTLPQQDVTTANPSTTRRFSGSGTVNYSSKVITINYTEVVGSSTYTGTFTVTKQ
jgi:trimeric autotransporter adhesin